VSQYSRTGFFWVILALLVFALVSVVQKVEEVDQEISYSKFLEEVKSGEIKSVVIDGNIISGDYTRSTKKFRLVKPDHEGLIDSLMEQGVEIKAVQSNENSGYWLVLSQVIPLLLMVGLSIFLLRQLQIGAGKGMSFGKSRARLLTESQHKVTFADVAGIDEARAELEEIIEFLKDPKKFTRLGGRIPKGVLLVGSPGTGKTLLAKAIAGEAGVPFFSISGSDFVEMFVGVGASRVRDLFVQGKKNAPCIIFIDEIDAVGRHRGAGMGGGHDEREQTLNQLLVEMDGFESNDGVILIAATNRPDVLDPALLRPGRFDRRVVVPNPDLNGRLGILKVHTRKVPVAEGVDLSVIARGTPGFSGADLQILVNEAALNAARKNKDKVEKDDFEYAKDKVMMGAERRSMLLTDKEKETTAYHESGHALVAKMLPNSDPVHKLTIIPRGMALGLMQQLPENDKHTYSKSYWLDQLAVFYGGRVAEELVFGELNTGASNDIERATQIARRMVSEWGMSDNIGPIHYSSRDEHVFLGRDFGKPREHSENMQVAIDQEVKSILMKQKEIAEKIVKDNQEILHRMAKFLIERETLDAEEIEKIIKGEEIPPKVKSETKKEVASSENDSALGAKEAIVS
jgi:cell division protease FtsH